MGKRKTKPQATSCKQRPKNGKIATKNPKALFKCDVCSKEFDDRYKMVSHQNCHVTDTPYSCEQCSYRGKTKKYLARHIKKVHWKRSRDHECSYCGKLFLHQSGLKVHTMVHTGEKPHSCKVCGKTFRVTYSLNSHMLIHTNEKPFQCSFCDYACRDSSTLRKHQNKHMGLEKIYECKICNKGYKTRAVLKMHISEVHLDVDMRKYPCGQCDRLFKSNAHRQVHIKSIHKRALVCECPICGRRISNKHNLQSHMRTHLDERPFSCTHAGCNLAFKDKNSLTKHSVIHDPSLHYSCTYCGRKFARKSHVQRHERVMHLERKRGVECNYCGSKFYSKNYLLKHIQTKHVYKQKFKYVCDKCGLTTHNKPSIVMHLKYGHSNDHDLQCKICDNKIVYKKHMYLKLHYWRTHNIRYKITRKATNRKEPSVQVKVEPIEAESYEDIELMDVEKQEPDEAAEYESLDYSKRVLSEDITAAVLSDRTRSKEVDFDEFYIRHVFAKHEDKDDLPINSGVNEEQNQYVKRRIKQILMRTQKIEDAKALRKKQKLEEEMEKKKEEEEAKIRAERERQEIAELRRVRVAYNVRMNDALAKGLGKKEQVKIKFLKKNSVECNKNDDGNDEIMKTTRNKGNDDNSNENNDELNDVVVDYDKNDDVANNCNIVVNNDDLNDCNDAITSTGTHDNGPIDNTSHDKNTVVNKENILVNEEDILVNEENILVNEEDTAVDENENFSNKERIDVFNDNTRSKKGLNELNNKKDTCNETTDIKNNDNNKTNDIQNNITQNHVTCEKNDNAISTDDKNSTDKVKDDDNDAFDQPLLRRCVRNKTKNPRYKDDEVDYSDDESNESSDSGDVNEIGKTKKMEFKSFQCYVCLKLYQTKEQLIDHCQEHFDVCNVRTLTKCPICNHVSHTNIAGHMKRKHNVIVKIPFNKIKDRQTEDGTRYSYDVNGTILDVIPSVKILNKAASDRIDKERREKNDKRIVKTKLVKKGDSWIVEKESIDIEFDEIPQLTDIELHKCKVTDNDIDRLGQLSRIAKKKGLKMMFPCFKCDKICQNFSALKLHKRRHEDNPKPFKPKVYKRLAKPAVKEKLKLNTSNRTAFPKPITNKHKCDKKLKEFFECNIRGGDVEFWQFLKIFNKMNREKVNDFKDLEERTDFGNHLDYYKDVAGNDDQNVDGDESVVGNDEDEMANGVNEIENDVDEFDSDVEEIENDEDETENDDEIENDEDEIENHEDVIENDEDVLENDEDKIENDLD